MPTCGNESKISSIKTKIDQSTSKVQNKLEIVEEKVDMLQNHSMAIMDEKISSSSHDLNLRLEVTESELKTELTKISKKVDDLMGLQESNFSDSTSPSSEPPIQNHKLEMEQSMSKLQSEVSALSAKFDSFMKFMESKNIETRQQKLVLQFRI